MRGLQLLRGGGARVGMGVLLCVHLLMGAVRIITSVRPATGAWYYQEPEHFDRYVTDRDPDLLFIGGISHRRRGGGIGEVRNLITLAKERLDCEIILASGPVDADWREYDPDHPEAPLPATRYTPQQPDDFDLASLADELEVEFIDMATAWHVYLAESGKPYGWFHRDRIHANDRGRQVLARILEAYFAPDP